MISGIRISGTYVMFYTMNYKINFKTYEIYFGIGFDNYTSYNKFSRTYMISSRIFFFNNFLIKHNISFSLSFFFFLSKRATVNKNGGVVGGVA